MTPLHENEIIHFNGYLFSSLDISFVHWIPETLCFLTIDKIPMILTTMLNTYTITYTYYFMLNTYTITPHLHRLIHCQSMIQPILGKALSFVGYL